MSASSLPPEILSEIFHIVRPDIMHHVRNSRGQLSKFHHLLVVAWVCRSWRNAALGCPTLWNTIFRHFSAEAVEWMVQHAAPCPLVVYTDGLASHNPLAHLMPVLREFARVQEFHLSINLEWDIQEAKAAIHTISAFSVLPLLQLFDLTLLHDALADDARFSNVSMPNLRCLKLGVSGAWTSEVFPAAPNLTSLTIYDWHSLNGDDVHRTMGHVAERYPVLASLGLDGCHPSPRVRMIDSRPLSPTEPVPLPALKLLRLKGTAEQIASLATYARIPRSCKVTAGIMLDWNESSWSAPAARELHNVMRARTDGSQPAYSTGYFGFTFNRFVVMLDDAPLSLRSALHSTTAVRNIEDDHTPAAVVLKWTGLQWYDHSAWIEGCHTLFPLEHLRTVIIHAISIKGRAEDVVAAWAAFLRRMTRVETLRINEWPVYDFAFLSALAYDTPILLPSLGYLIVDGICCAEQQRDWVWPEDYIRYFAARQKSGFPLEQISLSACVYHKDCQDRVARVVEGYNDLPAEKQLGIPVLLRASPDDDL